MVTILTKYMNILSKVGFAWYMPLSNCTDVFVLKPKIVAKPPTPAPINIETKTGIIENADIFNMLVKSICSMKLNLNGIQNPIR